MELRLINAFKELFQKLSKEELKRNHKLKNKTRTLILLLKQLQQLPTY